MTGEGFRPAENILLNLLRHKPPQVYFAQFRAKGKLIRQSPKTNPLRFMSGRRDG
jgi:hypothetical protein